MDCSAAYALWEAEIENKLSRYSRLFPVELYCLSVLLCASVFGIDQMLMNSFIRRALFAAFYLLSHPFYLAKLYPAPNGDLS
jgi:hypothetical protein